MDDVQLAPARVALAMSVVEPFANPADDERRQLQRHPLAAPLHPLEDRAHVLARHVLHRDVVRVVDLPQVERLGQVGMTQLRGDLRLVDEHLDELFVLGDGREDALDRDQLFEALDADGLGLVDLGHPADVDAVEQEILSERCESLGHLNRPVYHQRQRCSRARICWNRGNLRSGSRSGSFSSQTR